MEFLAVTENDHQFLFDLMLERDDTVNISHHMPTYDEHVEFCNSNPYPHRYIVWAGDDRVGTCYVTERREIGIFVAKKFQGMGYGERILKWLLAMFNGEKLYANINPLNDRSKKLFKKNKFRLIQETYTRP